MGPAVPDSAGHNLRLMRPSLSTADSANMHRVLSHLWIQGSRQDPIHSPSSVAPRWKMLPSRDINTRLPFSRLTASSLASGAARG